MKEKHVYRLYTENAENLIELTARYFDGATLYDALGIWNEAIRYEQPQIKQEQACVIEIVSETDRLQDVLFLAGDIRHTNKQTEVLITVGKIQCIAYRGWNTPLVENMGDMLMNVEKH